MEAGAAGLLIRAVKPHHTAQGHEKGNSEGDAVIVPSKRIVRSVTKRVLVVSDPRAPQLPPGRTRKPEVPDKNDTPEN